MSGTDEVEPMDTSEQPSTSHEKCAEDKDEVRIALSVKWSEGDQPQKCKAKLQKALQTWANKGSFGGEFTVVDVSEDGRAVIKIQPVPALRDLQKLSGQTLIRKDEKLTVTITAVTLKWPELDTQSPNSASVNVAPSSFVSEPQHEQVQPVEQSTFSSSAAVSIAGEETSPCMVPVGHFWYVNHIHEEEIKRIEKENGVKLVADVNVTFKADHKDGDPGKALSKFTDLVQKCLAKFECSDIPLNQLDPEKLGDTVKIIQKKENELLVTLSSKEMTVFGPKQSQELLKTAKKNLTNTDTPAGESAWASQDTSLNIDMSIKDPLVDTGVTIEENYWKLMTTSFNEHIAKIKAKFGVDFKESGISQSMVEVKAQYKRSGGNASMESHAVRALLHLYQKIATSPMNFTHHHGAMGLSGSPGSSSHVYQSEGASGGPVLNGQSGHSMRNTEAATEEGAGAGDSEDEKCPICMDKFTNKEQLKCKHEFCAECLARSKESLGAMCPVCRDVFGMIEGDQPDGKMLWQSNGSSLPGFSNCGTIIITYDIPSGIQTKKHPKPGKYYYGINRTAYLPDNKEGQEVLQLLKKAFDRKLIFTVGTSRTTGMENQVTWNDIHHKTSTHGGPQGFGYPDPAYLSRVREELKAKGVE